MRRVKRNAKKKIAKNISHKLNKNISVKDIDNLIRDMKGLKREADNAIAKAKELKSIILNIEDLNGDVQALETAIEDLETNLNNTPEINKENVVKYEIELLKLLSSVDKLTNVMTYISLGRLPMVIQKLNRKLLTIKDKISKEDYDKVIDLIKDRKISEAEALLSKLAQKALEGVNEENADFL